MNLCLYTATFLPTIGGAELVLHELATSLTARGHGVTVLAPYVRGGENRVDVPYRLRRYRRPSSKRFGVRQVLLYLMHEYWRRPFDVLHCHGAYPPAYVGATFTRLFDVPMVVRPHGADILPGEHIRSDVRLERRLRRALAAADVVIAQSEFLGRELLGLDVPAGKIRLIPNGVRLAQFGGPMPALSFPYPYILAMGSFTRKKGFDLLLRAFAAASAAEPGVHLIIAGAGREQPAHVALARELAIADRVHFPGLVQGLDKVGLFHGCLFFVCPSRREPFATVNLEALAAAKPIVATAVGGNVEVVFDGVNGLLAPPDDPAALVAPILRLLKEPELRIAMGRESARLAARFDWDAIGARYMAVFEEARRAHGAEQL